MPPLLKCNIDAILNQYTSGCSTVHEAFREVITELHAEYGTTPFVHELVELYNTINHETFSEVMIKVNQYQG